MKQILLSLLSILLICEIFSPSIAQGSLSRPEAAFVEAAAAEALFQTELGSLAEVKGADITVKYFGESMANIYSKAHEQLQTLAKENNMELPQQMANESQKLYDALSRLKSDEFDEEYMTLMVEAHTAAVATFEREQYLVTDPALKEWISAMLPVLRSRLQRAKEIFGVLSGGSLELYTGR